MSRHKPSSAPGRRPGPHAGARHPRRVTVAELELRARHLIKAAASRPGMLVLRLNRSDRVRALSRRADAMRVLVQALDRIEAALRPDDRYAVVAVDEIWILMASAPGESLVQLAATNVRDRLIDTFDGVLDDGTAVRVTFDPRVGGAWCDRPVPEDEATLLSWVASHACERADRQEGRVVVLATSTSPSRTKALRQENRLRAALENNELEVHYQPQVRLRDWQCRSVEALIRWPSDQAEPMLPATIASVCEETGMMDALTHFVLNTSMRNLAAWSTQGANVIVGVNLSAVTLSDRSFPQMVEQLCSTWGVDPSQLLFELTEGSIAKNERATLDFMHRLRELGCGLSIDDFGTGYSSFTYLRHFPVDELKIDRSFVHRLAHESADRRIVQAVVELAHTFGLRALAEGAEDAATVDVLRKVGCDIVQGWFVAKAMDGAEVAEWVTGFNQSSRPSAEVLPATYVWA